MRGGVGPEILHFNNLPSESDAASLIVTLLSSMVLEKIEKAIHIKTLIRLKQSGGPS